MRLDYRAMTCWVLACGVPPAAGGAWLAREWGSPGALAAAAAGAGIALAVLLASGAAVAKAGRRSPTRAAFLFTGAGIVRIVLAAGLAAGAWTIWSLATTPLLLSMLACYLAGSAGECVWLVRAIRDQQVASRPACKGLQCS